MQPDSAIKAEPKKCGAGKGAECCIFLMCGPKGFECARFGSLHAYLAARTDMHAKRNPTAPFPTCQIEEV